MDLPTLEQALVNQEIFAHNEDAAKTLAADATVRSLREGETLFSPVQKRHGAIFFIISGSIRLSTDERSLAVRRDRQCLGEFPLLDTKFQNNQVTAEALEKTVVAEVEYQYFDLVTKACPSIWKEVAHTLALRLDQTSKSDSFSGDIRRYEQIATNWLWLSRVLWAVHYTIGSLALLLSGLVSAKITMPGLSHDVLAWLASLMTALLAFLSPEGRAIRLRQGWVKLNGSLVEARANTGASIDGVIQAHQESEAIIGKPTGSDEPTSEKSRLRRAVRRNANSHKS